MKKIEVELINRFCWQHLNVNSIDNSADDTMSNEELKRQTDEWYKHKNHFICGDLCGIDITNTGQICLTFNEDKTENELREYTAILLYFISICCGYNCEYKKEATIDDKLYNEFFTYAKEDKLDDKLYKNCNLYKNIKYHEISLSDISLQFGEIIYKLFTFNRRYILTLLSNYYSLVVYKDFIGNGEYLFRNVITNVESIITSINEKTYKGIESENKQYINDLIEKYKIKRREINKHLISKSVSLKEKLKDAINMVEDMLKIKFKFDKDIECEKIANTRNLISHVFTSDKVYLTDNEISIYKSVFSEIFRILFLHYLNIDCSLIYNRFFMENRVIRLTLSQVFEVSI